MFFWLAYIISTAVHLFSIVLELPTVGFISKALLMPILGLVVYKSNIWVPKIKLWLMLALLFSWFGDLLLTNSEYVFFLLGLVSFLTAHIFYIFIFGKESRMKGELSRVGGTPSLILPFVVYGIVLLYLVIPKLDDLVVKIAIVVYATVILTMATQAFNRISSVSRKSFIWVFLGAILFVLSDSMIAINKFVIVDFDYARMAIMTTYIVAQAFIVKGVLQHVSDNKLVHAF